KTNLTINIQDYRDDELNLSIDEDVESEISKGNKDYRDDELNLPIDEDVESEISKGNKDYRDDELNLSIDEDVESEISKGNNEAKYMLQWCIICFPESNKINISSGSTSTAFCLSAIGQPIYATSKKDINENFRYVHIV
ncbi:10086_t:CDS:1, partial [Racocetra fulgida]